MDRINKLELILQKEKLEDIRLKNIDKQIENDRILANKIHNDINRDLMTINDHIIATELLELPLRRLIAVFDHDE